MSEKALAVCVAVLFLAGCGSGQQKQGHAVVTPAVTPDKGHNAAIAKALSVVELQACNRRAHIYAPPPETPEPKDTKRHVEDLQVGESAWICCLVSYGGRVYVSQSQVVCKTGDAECNSENSLIQRVQGGVLVSCGHRAIIFPWDMAGDFLPVVGQMREKQPLSGGVR